MPPAAVRLLRAANSRIIGRVPGAAGVAATDDRIAGVRVRIYRPALADAVMAYAHGGGFISGSLATHHSLCSHLAQAAQLTLVAIDYRLAPEHPAPAQLDDVLAVATALAANGPLLLGGDSAGAYLAARAALALGAERRPAAGLILFNPFIDMAGGSETLHLSGRGVVRTMRRLVGTSAYPSLLTYPPRAVPPTVIVWGGWLDPVAPGAAALADAWARAGVPVQRCHHPVLPHGGVNLAGRSAGARTVIAQAAAALRGMIDAR